MYCQETLEIFQEPDRGTGQVCPLSGFLSKHLKVIENVVYLAGIECL